MNIAGTDRIEFVYQLQYQLYRIAEAVGSVILSAFLIDHPRFEDPGEWFARNAYVRIALPVFEQDVIARMVLLDEIVLQQERILFAIYHYIAYIRYMRYQLARLGRLMVFVEIAVYAPV